MIRHVDFIYRACIIDIDGAMELRYSSDRVEVKGKPLTALDKFVISYVRLLEEHSIKLNVRGESYRTVVR